MVRLKIEEQASDTFQHLRNYFSGFILAACFTLMALKLHTHLPVSICNVMLSYDVHCISLLGPLTGGELARLRSRNGKTFLIWKMTKTRLLEGKG